MVGHIAHVRWAAHGREMSSFVSAIRNKEVYSDCLLCCKDGYQIPAHRAVLAMASPFFNVIFRSYPATGTTPCIVLEGVDRDQIDALLHYIYFGSLVVKCDRLPALSKTAKALGIKEFPSLEIAPPVATYSNGREEARPRDDNYSERPSKRASLDRAMSVDFSDDNSWSQPKKRKWDAPIGPIHTQDYIGASSRQIGNPVARPLHNPYRVPVLKQLLSPSYHINSEKSHKVPNDFMAADLPDRAARETILVSPNKSTAAPLRQNKISEEEVKMEDSDELVEVCQLSDDDTPAQQKLQRNSGPPSDSSCQGEKGNAWECSKPPGPMPYWYPDTSILQTELGRPRSVQDSREEKSSTKTTSLTVNSVKSGSQSVSPRPVHSPLTPPAIRPNSVPTTGFPSSSQGPFDLSIKSSSNEMPRPTPDRNNLHTQPNSRTSSNEMPRPTPDRNNLHTQQNSRTKILNKEDVNDLQEQILSEEHVKINRLLTVDPKKYNTDFKQEKSSRESIKSSSIPDIKCNKYNNQAFLESEIDVIKHDSMKHQSLIYSYDSTSSNKDEKKFPKIYSEGETTSKTPLISKIMNGSVTSTSRSNSAKPGPKTGPPALLSMVNGKNGWKFRETSTLRHGSIIVESNARERHHHQSHSMQRPSFIPLNSIGPKIEKFSVNSESYSLLHLQEKKRDPTEVSTTITPPGTAFENHKEKKGHQKGASLEVKLERNSSETPPTGSKQSDVAVTDPLLTKITTTKRRRVRGPKSWEYLLRLLRDPSTNPSLIRWENEQEGIFRLVKPDAIALRWGKRTGKHCTDMLSYENFARGLRYHYVTGALSAVSERCFVYKFGPKAEKALKYSDCIGDVVPSKMIPGAPVTTVI